MCYEGTISLFIQRNHPVSLCHFSHSEYLSFDATLICWRVIISFDSSDQSRSLTAEFYFVLMIISCHWVWLLLLFFSQIVTWKLRKPMTMLFVDGFDLEKGMELEDFETETRWWSLVEILTDTHVSHWIEYNWGYVSSIPALLAALTLTETLGQSFSPAPLPATRLTE